MSTDRRVHRIEVRPRHGMPDARGDRARVEAESLGLTPAPERIDCARVYLIEGPLDEPALGRLTRELLADPVTEEATVGSAPAQGSAHIEVHPQPGVMDPDAEAVELAIRTMLDIDATVRTGVRYDLHGADDDAARRLAERSLANPVIQDVHTEAYHTEAFPIAAHSTAGTFPAGEAKMPLI